MFVCDDDVVGDGGSFVVVLFRPFEQWDRMKKMQQIVSLVASCSSMEFKFKKSTLAEQSSFNSSVGPVKLLNRLPKNVRFGRWVCGRQACVVFFRRLHGIWNPECIL